MAEEGGRGVCLRQFLLPPLPLFPLGGGLGGTGDLLLLGHPVRDRPLQPCPNSALLVPLHPRLRHGGRKHQLIADAAVSPNPTLRPHLSERSRPSGGWCVLGVQTVVLHTSRMKCGGGARTPTCTSPRTSSPALAIFGRCAVWCDIVARAAATDCCSCRHHERSRRCIRRQAAPKGCQLDSSIEVTHKKKEQRKTCSSHWLVWLVWLVLLWLWWWWLLCLWLWL